MQSPDELQELLAWLDAVDAAGGDLPATISPGNFQDGGLSANMSPLPGSSERVPYTTQYQRRRRGELEALRVEVERLDSQLKYLHRRRRGPKGAVALRNMNLQREWRAEAMVQCERKLRSEWSNRRLKAAVSEQSRLVSAVRKVLRHHRTEQELEFVRLLQPSTDCQRLRIDFSDSIFAKMSDKLKQLQTTALPDLGDGTGITFRSQFKTDGLQGGCFETTARTPMACTHLQAESIVWDYALSSTNKTNADEAFDFVRLQSNDPNTLNEIQCTVAMVIQDGLGSHTQVEGASSFRKAKEGNQIIQVATMTWFLPDEHLQFEDEYSIVVSPSPTDPENSSVVQTHYVLRCSSLITEPVKRTSDVALQSIGQRARRYIQLRHDAYLEHANSVFLV